MAKLDTRCGFARWRNELGSLFRSMTGRGSLITSRRWTNEPGSIINWETR